MGLGDVIRAIIKISVWGIFGVSGIIVLIGGLLIAYGSLSNNSPSVENGWGLVKFGGGLFLAALVAWVYVKTREEG